MVKLRLLHSVAKWLFVISLALLLLTASIGMVASSRAFYRYGFEKYDVGRSTGLDRTELYKVADGLVSYFSSGEAYISLTVTREDQTFELFNEKEIMHLKDVKGLLRLNCGIMLGTLIYAIIYSGICLLQRRWHLSP